LHQLNMVPIGIGEPVLPVIAQPAHWLTGHRQVTRLQCLKRGRQIVNEQAKMIVPNGTLLVLARAPRKEFNEVAGHNLKIDNPNSLDLYTHLRFFSQRSMKEPEQRATLVANHREVLPWLCILH
jgi:hypothetical protein